MHMMSSLAGGRRIVAFVALAMGPGISAAAQQPLQSQWMNSAASPQTHSSGPDQSVSWAMSVLFDQLFVPRSRQSSQIQRATTWGTPDMFFAQSMTCAALNGAWCNGADVESGHIARGAYDQLDYYAILAWSLTRSLPFLGQSWSQPSPYTPGYFFWRWSQPSRPDDGAQGSVFAAPTWTKTTTGDANGGRPTQAELGCRRDDASCMQATPEPGTLALLGTGLVTLGAWRRRRRTVLARA